MLNSNDNTKRKVILSEKYGFNCSEQRTVEVSEEILQAFEDFRREENRYKMNAYRHQVPFGFCEVEAAEIGGKIFQSAEDEFYENIRNERLYSAIRQLSEANQRRFLLYVAEDMTLEEIAKLEGVSINAVAKSIRYSKRTLKKLLTDCEYSTISDFDF